MGFAGSGGALTTTPWPQREQATVLPAKLAGTTNGISH